MNREQAVAFLNALNAAGPYVPPIVFQAIAQNVVLQMIARVADGQSTCVITEAPKVAE